MKFSPAPLLVRFLTVLAAIGQIMVSWASQLGWFGATIPDVSDEVKSVVVPAAYAFIVWSLIFTLCGAYAGYQLLVGSDSRPTAQSIRTPLLIAMLLNSAWMMVFPMRMFTLSLLVIALMLVFLLKGLNSVDRSRTSSWPDHLASATIQLFAGWISLATFVNASEVAVSRGLDFPLLHFALLTAAGVTALLVNWINCGLFVYTTVVCWGLVGVLVGQWDTGASATVSALLAAALALALLGQLIWIRTLSLPTATDENSARRG